VSDVNKLTVNADERKEEKMKKDRTWISFYGWRAKISSVSRQCIASFHHSVFE
jgi:hypothetical protein